MAQNPWERLIKEKAEIDERNASIKEAFKENQLKRVMSEQKASNFFKPILQRMDRGFLTYPLNPQLPESNEKVENGETVEKGEMIENQFQDEGFESTKGRPTDYASPESESAALKGMINKYLENPSYKPGGLRKGYSKEENISHAREFFIENSKFGKTLTKRQQNYLYKPTHLDEKYPNEEYKSEFYEEQTGSGVEGLIEEMASTFFKLKKALASIRAGNTSLRLKTNVDKDYAKLNNQLRELLGFNVFSEEDAKKILNNL